MARDCGRAAPRWLLAVMGVAMAWACDSQPSDATRHAWPAAGGAPQPRLRAAFVLVPSHATGMGKNGAACMWRSRAGLSTPTPRVILKQAGAMGMRAMDDGGDLRDEFQELLGKSGRDRGMREMKAPKGSLEWLKQQQSAKGTAKPAPPAARPVQPDGPVETLKSAPSGPSLVGPPVAKPRAQVPAPTYEDLDALLSGKTPSAQPVAAPVPEVVAPAARPAYAVDSAREGSSVALASFDKGDAVPDSVWDALNDGEGRSLALSVLRDEGAKLVLVVPESAHHTGGPAETWTKLLIELQNTLGSQPDQVKAVAISPESNEVHAKMMTRYNLKLFHFVSDSERAVLQGPRLPS